MAVEYKLSYTGSQINEKLNKIDSLAAKSEIPKKVSDLTNDSGFITNAPVASVNGMTGAVNLTASDVGALPSTTQIPSIEGLATEEYVDNAIANIGSGSGSGSAESNVLVVTATMDGDTGTASHSLSEIKDAYSAGKAIVLNTDTATIPLFQINTTVAHFYNTVINVNKAIKDTYLIVGNNVYYSEDEYSVATIDDVNSAISTAITSAIGGSY